MRAAERLPPNWDGSTWGRIVFVGLFFVIGMLFTLIHRLVRIGQRRARLAPTEVGKDKSG